jgi:hypothetical protein
MSSLPQIMKKRPPFGRRKRSNLITRHMRLFGIASAAVVIVGKAKLIGRSLLGGTIRSRHNRSAMESPSFAFSILGLAIEQLLHHDCASVT